MRRRCPNRCAALRREIHDALRQALFDFGRHQFNTVVSGGMKMLNALARIEAGERGAADAVRREGLSLLLRLLSPIVPHIAHALWRDLGYGDDVLDAAWPVPDETGLGAVAGDARGAGQRQAARPDRRAGGRRARALSSRPREAEPNVRRFVEGKPMRKIVVVPGKLVNLVC
jgi:leucyl-tRNA synthetase